MLRFRRSTEELSHEESRACRHHSGAALRCWPRPLRRIIPRSSSTSAAAWRLRVSSRDSSRSIRTCGWCSCVTDAKGTREISFEGHSTNNMYRAGYRDGMIKVGDKVTVYVAPLRDGSDGRIRDSRATADGTALRAAVACRAGTGAGEGGRANNERRWRNWRPHRELTVLTTSSTSAFRIPVHQSSSKSLPHGDSSKISATAS